MATQVSISGLCGRSRVTDHPCMLHNHLTARSPKKVFLFFWARELYQILIFCEMSILLKGISLLLSTLILGLYLLLGLSLRRSFFREFREFFITISKLYLKVSLTEHSENYLTMSHKAKTVITKKWVLSIADYLSTFSLSPSTKPIPTRQRITNTLTISSCGVMGFLMPRKSAPIRNYFYYQTSKTRLLQKNTQASRLPSLSQNV